MAYEPRPNSKKHTLSLDFRHDQELSVTKHMASSQLDASPPTVAKSAHATFPHPMDHKIGASTHETKISQDHTQRRPFRSRARCELAALLLRGGRRHNDLISVDALRERARS